MKIGELAKQCKLSTHTLRYYEKLGLLVPKKHVDNNYREYTDDDLATARFIKRCKESGFSLQDTASLVSIKDAKDKHTCEEAKNITQNKIHILENQINQLLELKHVLSQLSDRCCGGQESAEFCSIISQLESTDYINKPKLSGVH